MNRTLQIFGCALGVLLVSACSSGGTSASGYQKSATPEPSATPAAVAPTGPVGIATAPNSLGPILTRTHPRAVYLFEADPTSNSTCTGGCAKQWPPLTIPGHGAKWFLLTLAGLKIDDD